MPRPVGREPDPAPSEPLPAAGVSEGQGGRAAALVTAGIFVSRIFGLVLRRTMAHFFGVTGLADAITAAFRVGNITQNLLGEGTLSASFIPLYAKLRARGKTLEAAQFARACFGLLFLVVAAASALGSLGAPALARAFSAGFDDARRTITADLLRLVFPMTGLLVLSALCLGVLNAHRRFFLPYAAPVVWNVAQIGGLYLFGAWLHHRGESLAMALAASALVGAALQFLFLLPAVRSLLGGIRPSFDIENPHVREAASKLPGVLLGRGVIQISGLIDTLLVSFLGAGANAAFGYAQTVYLLPMSLLGTGEAAAALPELSEHSAEQDVEKKHALLRKRLGASLARVTTLAVPAMLVFLVLGRELLSVLLETGSFDQQATARVEPLLAAYAFALLGNASGRLFATTAYALGDTAMPARYALYRVLASTALSLVLMQRLDVLGVVLGAVVAAWVETVALGLRLHKTLGGLGLDAVPWTKVVVLGALSIGPSAAVRWALPPGLASGRLVSLGLLALAGFAFAGAASGLRLFSIRSLLRRR